MWGLAHPSLFNGEGGYYLTTLTSAVNVLKELTQPPAQPVPSAQVETVICTCITGKLILKYSPPLAEWVKLLLLVFSHLSSSWAEHCI